MDANMMKVLQIVSGEYELDYEDVMHVVTMRMRLDHMHEEKQGDADNAFNNIGKTDEFKLKGVETIMIDDVPYYYESGTRKVYSQPVGKAEGASEFIGYLSSKKLNGKKGLKIVPSLY